MTHEPDPRRLNWRTLAFPGGRAIEAIYVFDGGERLRMVRMMTLEQLKQTDAVDQCWRVVEAMTGIMLETAGAPQS